MNADCTDLLPIRPPGSRRKKFVVECEVLRGGLDETPRKGLAQTAWQVDR